MDRSHAPYSPIASTSRVPYRPGSPVVPSSDVGEGEELRAARMGEGYWKAEEAVEEDEEDGMQLDEQPGAELSEDELAMSPFRPTARPQPSASLRAPLAGTSASPSKSPAAFDSPAPSSLASPAPRVSSRTSPQPRADSPDTPRARSPSPARSNASSSVTALFTRPRRPLSLSALDSSPSQSARSPSQRARSPTPRRSSPARSPSRSQSRSPTPDIPPDPDALLARGRSFRTRTAAQLNPYTTEQVRYTRSLLKNGWEGAVVRGKKAVEETAEELRRRKEEMARRPRDSLGGWLVDEVEGTQQEEEGGRGGEADSEDEDMSDASADGLTLLVREARRKEKMSRAADAALLGKKRKHSPHRHGPSRLDDPHYRADSSSKKKKSRPRTYASSSRRRDSASSSTSDDDGASRSRARLSRAESAPPTSSPAHSHSKKRPRHGAASRPRKAATGEDGDGARKSRKHHVRADSEPPALSPRRGGVAVPKRRGMGKPSKAVHGRAADDGRSALDRDILNHLPVMPSSSSSEGGGFRSDGESEEPSEAEEDDEEAAGRLKPSRLELGQKRKRALGFMMPAVFMKKAEADLRLMERERDEGDWSSGSEINSGDEEALKRAERNRARRRTVPRLLDEPMRFDGDAYTDESGDDARSDDGLRAEQDEQDEQDAVSSWLQSFAPGRGRGGDDDDIVDRFLKRARRPTKPRKEKSKKRARGQAGGPAQAKGKGKERAKEQDARAKGGRAQDGVVVAGYRPVPAAKRKTKTIALDTDQAVFAFAGLREEGAELSDDEVVVLSPRLPPAARQPALDLAGFPAAPETAKAAADGEIWASFGKFSYDFGIQRLPGGIQFTSPDSFVRSGHLYSLVEPSSIPAAPFATDSLGMHLSSAEAPDALEALFPQLCDAVFDLLRPSLAIDVEPVNPLPEIGAALRFLGHYISTTLSRAAPDVQSSFGRSLLGHLERLETRLDAIVPQGSAVKTLHRQRIALSWLVVDLAARVRSFCAADTVSSERVLAFATSLVRRLVQHGADRTMKNLKAATDSPDSGVADLSVEAWLGLVSLAVKASERGEGALSEEDLWRITIDEVKASTGKKADKGPGVGEVISYTTMMLCAVSQFSPSGLSTSKPRLGAYWPAVMRTLEAIQPAALAQPDNSLSSTAVARRDRYLWTLFARCLVFAERWGWRVEGNELLGRLFDLLNARRLADLTTETKGDIPAFLQNLDEFGDVRLDPSRDTAFVIFLKLVVAASNIIPFSTDAEKRKRGVQLTRLFVRLTPMASSSWSRSSTEITRSGSILVNHYSLQLAFAMLHPAAASQRIEHARRLLDFPNVDEEARKTCIRSILHFALICRWNEVALTPVVDWLASVTATLTKEYVDVERQRRKEEGRWAKDRDRSSAKGDPLWHRALMVTMVLRAVQVLLKWKKSGEGEQEYPDIGLLHPAWTTQLLQSPLALDPMIGRETVKTMSCFFDVRRAALPRPPQPQLALADGNGESQDDYGMLDDLDFDDPALNALLGIETTGNAAGGSTAADEVRAKDKALGELVKTRLSRAFFDLVSKIYVDSAGSGPTVTDRAAYAQYTIECWVRCIAVAVESQVADWRPYLQYGDQSWKRISDPVGRRDVGLFLIVEILKHDPAVYSLFLDDILEIWLESLVARRLTAQHDLTAFLLDVEAHNIGTVSPLLDKLPFGRDTSGKAVVEQLDLLDKRGEVLQMIFANAARFASSSAGAGPPLISTPRFNAPATPTVSRGTVLNLVRCMLGAMRDNLAAINDENSRKAYATFVKMTLASLLGAGAVNGKPGPFTESSLADLRSLRSAVS
ncbi:hypothetical protein JCM10207_001627 [Rhodosporidiobolus poonsookiae]